MFYTVDIENFVLVTAFPEYQTKFPVKQVCKFINEKIREYTGLHLSIIITVGLDHNGVLYQTTPGRCTESDAVNDGVFVFLYTGEIPRLVNESFYFIYMYFIEF